MAGEKAESRDRRCGGCGDPGHARRVPSPDISSRPDHVHRPIPDPRQQLGASAVRFDPAARRPGLAHRRSYPSVRIDVRRLCRGKRLPGAIDARSKPTGLAPVASVVADLSAKTGTAAEARGFGGLGEDGLEAVSVGRRNVIRIGTLRELQCIRKPDAFRFGAAHEIAHLSGGDPQVERIVAAAYFWGGAFILAGIARVLVAVIGDPLSLVHLGFGAVNFAVRSALPALMPNLVAFGTLAGLLFAESRSARRLREFHADAVVRELTGNVRGVGGNLAAAPAAPSFRSPACGRRAGGPEAAPRGKSRRSFL